MDFMKIAEISIYRFRLRLNRPLALKNDILKLREGFVMRLSDESGNCGWGEISPLIGFSRETIEQAGSGRRGLARWVVAAGARADLRAALGAAGVSVADGRSKSRHGRPARARAGDGAQRRVGTDP